MNWSKLLIRAVDFVFSDIPYLLSSKNSVLKKAQKLQYDFSISGYHKMDRIWEHIERPHFGKLGNINAADKHGNTLLHYFGGRYHFSLPWAPFLLSKGADANLPNKAGDVPLKFMARHLNISKRHLLAGYSIPKDTPEEMLYPKALVQATTKENLNKVYADGNTILTDIINNNIFITPALIENLIKDGCDPCVPERHGLTPAQLFLRSVAMKYCPRNAFSIVSEYDESILVSKEVEEYKKTLPEVFFNCIQKKLLPLTPIFFDEYTTLVSKCDDPHKLEDEGYLRACFLGALLLDEKTHLPEMNFLLQKIATGEISVFFAGEKAPEMKTAVLNKILALSTDIDEKNEQGQTPLQLAIENNNADLAFLLIKNGADILTADNAGNTLIHSAAKGKCSSVLFYLLSKKQLDANVLNNQGETPLSLTDGNQQIIALLLQHESTPAKQEKVVFDFDELTSKQTADMLIAGNGVDVARKTKKLRAAMEYMNHKDRMRAYVHIQKQLTEKEKQDFEAIIRSGSQQTPQKVACAPIINQKPENQKTME